MCLHLDYEVDFHHRSNNVGRRTKQLVRTSVWTTLPADWDFPIFPHHLCPVLLIFSHLDSLTWSASFMSGVSPIVLLSSSLLGALWKGSILKLFMAKISRPAQSTLKVTNICFFCLIWLTPTWIYTRIQQEVKYCRWKGPFIFTSCWILVYFQVGVPQIRPPLFYFVVFLTTFDIMCQVDALVNHKSVPVVKQCLHFCTSSLYCDLQLLVEFARSLLQPGSKSVVCRSGLWGRNPPFNHQFIRLRAIKML